MIIVIIKKQKKRNKSGTKKKCAAHRKWLFCLFNPRLFDVLVAVSIFVLCPSKICMCMVIMNQKPPSKIIQLAACFLPYSPCRFFSNCEMIFVFLIFAFPFSSFPFCFLSFFVFSVLTTLRSFSSSLIFSKAFQVSLSFVPVQ